MALHSNRVLDAPSSSSEPAQSYARARRWDTPFCIGLIILSVGVLLLDMRASGPEDMSRGLVPPGLAYGALYGPAVAAGEWWRVLSTLIVHAGLLHLVFNMSAVLNLGRPVERLLGTGRFAYLSLATALGSSLLALAFNFDARTVGASGMILGWLGVLLPIASPAVRSSLWPTVFLVAAISLVPGISWAGHLGGFLFGLPIGFALRMKSRPFWSVTSGLILLGIVALFSVVTLGSAAGFTGP